MLIVAVRCAVAMALLSAVIGRPSVAADIKYTADYSRCMEAAKGATFAIIECTTDETKRWDMRLNTNYKVLMAKLSPGQKNALAAAEVAWLKFRDTNCEFWADPEGGQAARIAGNSCYLELTAMRAEELGVSIKMH